MLTNLIFETPVKYLLRKIYLLYLLINTWYILFAVSLFFHDSIIVPRFENKKSNDRAACLNWSIKKAIKSQ